MNVKSTDKDRLLASRYAQNKCRALVSSAFQDDLESEDYSLDPSSARLGHGDDLEIKKELSEMDEDELMLTSDKGKQLTAKERRQLRNRVSARQFRLRRKEYITHLEGLVGDMTNKVRDLNKSVRSLRDENQSLKEKVAMLEGRSPPPRMTPGSETSQLGQDLSPAALSPSSNNKHLTTGSVSSGSMVSPEGMPALIVTPGDAPATQQQPAGDMMFHDFTHTNPPQQLRNPQSVVSTHQGYNSGSNVPPTIVSHGSHRPPQAMLNNGNPQHHQLEYPYANNGGNDGGVRMSPNVANLLPQYNWSYDWPLAYDNANDRSQLAHDHHYQHQQAQQSGQQQPQQSLQYQQQQERQQPILGAPSTSIYRSFLPEIEKPVEDNATREQDSDGTTTASEEQQADNTVSDSVTQNETRLRLALEAAENMFRQLDSQLANLQL
uniref:ARAD1D00660p n=1 Tax=Blastobotrys adeninivorans TaxID=409370 RepID=A0A060T750_BLAAD